MAKNNNLKDFLRDFANTLRNTDVATGTKPTGTISPLNFFDKITKIRGAPQLIAPTISINRTTKIVTVVEPMLVNNEQNGNFVEGYYLYLSGTPVAKITKSTTNQFNLDTIKTNLSIPTGKNLIVAVASYATGFRHSLFSNEIQYTF